MFLLVIFLDTTLMCPPHQTSRFSKAEHREGEKNVARGTVQEETKDFILDNNRINCNVFLYGIDL